MKDHRRAGMPSAYPAALPRRVLTITGVWLLAVLTLVLSPVLIIAALLTDLVTRRPGWPTLRLLGVFGAFLLIEMAAELIVLWSWLVHPFVKKTWTERNHQLMHLWAGLLYLAAERIAGVRIEVDGPDDLGPGPLLVFSQHVSIVDAIAPLHVLGTRQGWYLRYTLTRGLRFVPSMDIVAHRIPNHFVARGASDNADGLATLRLLVTDMEDEEGAVIFPGGALFTPAVLARAVEKVTELGSPQAAKAATYRHVLPPRPGGVQAFFDGAPDAAVLIVGHTGFEPLSSLKNLWAVLPLTEPVELRIWRYERTEVPDDPDARLAWLYDRWSVMDAWIDERQAARSQRTVVAA